MPSIAQVLKQEVSRLSRREVRLRVDNTKKSVSRHQREIAELKRQVKALERLVAAMGRQLAAAPDGAQAEPATARVRFSASGLRAHRNRVGLSAADYAKLMGVSTQTIYNWERGATAPSQAQKSKLAALRRIGKREAGARLAASS